MITKRYSSPAAKFTINVKLEGKSVPIEFSNYDPEEKRRWYSTANPDIQQQFEKSPDFNVYFRMDNTSVTDDKQNEVAIKVPTEPQPASVRERIVKKTLAEAKMWANSIGIPYNKLKNKDQVINIVKDLGYDLEFEDSNK